MSESSSEDLVEEAIKLGVRDFDPRRVTNWCKYIKVEYVSTSALGQMIRLPTLGMKRISCRYAKTTHESVSLDTAALGFFEENCKDCAEHEEVSWDNLFRMKKPFFRFLKVVGLNLLRILNFLWNSKQYLGIFFASSIVYVLLQLVTIRYPDAVLTTLAQVNSTIFALAFTIPLVASQLGRYRTTTPIFSGFSLAYMLLYILTIFFSLLGSPLTIPLCFSLSVFCTLLLIPYLGWVKDGLSIAPILDRYNDRGIACISRNRKVEFRKNVDNIHYIAVQALNFKDYSILSSTMDKLVQLARHAFAAGFTVDTEEKYGWLFVGRAIQRIGEIAIGDRHSLNIISEKILKLDTEASPIGRRILTLQLKTMEFVFLAALAKFACDRNGFNAIAPVEALLRHTLGAFYKDHEELNNRIRGQTIQFLVTLPDQVVQYAFDNLETNYNVKYGGGDLKVTVLGQLARLYLDYRKIRFPKREKRKKAANRETLQND